MLGHLQRGGSPTVRDRLTASLMGVRAVECINQNRLNRVIVERNGRVDDLDIFEALAITKNLDEKVLAYAESIAL